MTALRPLAATQVLHVGPGCPGSQRQPWAIHDFLQRAQASRVFDDLLGLSGGLVHRHPSMNPRIEQMPHANKNRSLMATFIRCIC